MIFFYILSYSYSGDKYGGKSDLTLMCMSLAAIDLSLEELDLSSSLALHKISERVPSVFTSYMMASPPFLSSYVEAVAEPVRSFVATLIVSPV